MLNISVPSFVASDDSCRLMPYLLQQAITYEKSTENFHCTPHIFSLKLVEIFVLGRQNTQLDRIYIRNNYMQSPAELAHSLPQLPHRRRLLRPRLPDLALRLRTLLPRQ
jgi:hypothetical protein